MSKVVSITGEAIDIAAACNRQLAKCNHSISNGAVAKISGVPVSEITDRQEEYSGSDVYLEALNLASPLIKLYKEVKRLSEEGIKSQDPEQRILALRGIAQLNEDYMADFNDLSALRKDQDKDFV